MHKNLKNGAFSIIRKMETMGIYVKKMSIEKLKNYNKLREKFENHRLNDKVVELNNIIFICPENQDFFYNKLSEIDKKVLTKYKLFLLVFSHEIGHLIFNYINIKNRRIKERQANLVSSFLNNGLYDNEIKLKTDQQLNEYHEPLLISSKMLDYDLFLNEYEYLFEEEK